MQLCFLNKLILELFVFNIFKKFLLYDLLSDTWRRKFLFFLYMNFFNFFDSWLLFNWLHNLCFLFRNFLMWSRRVLLWGSHRPRCKSNLYNGVIVNRICLFFNFSCVLRWRMLLNQSSFLWLNFGLNLLRDF